jgi:hypothetical protein
MDLLELVETDARGRRKLAWSKYRNLLEKALDAGGELTEKRDGQAFVEVVRELGLSAADISNHRNLLKDRRRALVDREKLPTREAQLKTVDAQLNKLVIERDETMGRLADPINTLILESNRLHQEVGLLQITASLPEELERKAPELFAVEHKEPVPLPEPSREELVEASRSAIEKTAFVSAIAGILDGTINRARIGDHATLDAIEAGLIAGTWIVRDRAIVRSMLPPDQQEDPRKKRAQGIANKVKNGVEPQYLRIDDRYVLEAALRFGWIEADEELKAASEKQDKNPFPERQVDDQARRLSHLPAMMRPAPTMMQG